MAFGFIGKAVGKAAGLAKKSAGAGAQVAKKSAKLDFKGAAKAGKGMATSPIKAGLESFRGYQAGKKKQGIGAGAAGVGSQLGQKLATAKGASSKPEMGVQGGGGFAKVASPAPSVGQSGLRQSAGGAWGALKNKPLF